MSKINWKNKLTSRKFWAAVIGFVTAAVAAFNLDNISAEQVELFGWALAALIAYIVGEGLVDATRSNPSGIIEAGVIEVEEKDKEV